MRSKSRFAVLCLLGLVGPIFFQSQAVAAVTAPQSVKYSQSSAIYTKEIQIPANSPSFTGGVPTSYSITPQLPLGLALDRETGVISGKPNETFPKTEYTIIAANPAGRVSTQIALQVDFPVNVPSAKNCFKPTDSLSLPFQVVSAAVAPPQLSSTTGYFADDITYPASGFTFGSSDADIIPAVRPTSRDGLAFKYSYYLWANRCVNPSGVSDANCPNNVKTKGNWYRSPYWVTRNGAREQVRPIFSTLSKANACTRIQASFMLGDSDSLLQTMAANNGVTLVHFQDRTTAIQQHMRDISFPNGDSGSYIVDLCLLESAPMSVIDEIVVDYEVWDSRPLQTTTNVITLLATLAHQHGKTISLYVNPIDGGAPAANGIGQDNLDALLNAVDHFSFVVWSGATNGAGYELPPTPRTQSPVDNFLKELNIIRNYGARSVDPRKLRPVISLFDLQPAEATRIRSTILSQHIDGVEIWRNGATVGGSCSSPENETLRALYGLNFSGCKITLSACPKDPSFAGTFTDEFGAAYTSEHVCKERARAYYNSCGISPESGQTVTATFLSNGEIQGAKTIGESVCQISQASCPNHPEYAGTFVDKHNPANSSPAACMQMAAHYYSWCGISSSSGNTTKAAFYSNGSRIQSTVVGGQ